METGYANLENWANLMRFSKNSLEEAELLENHDRMSIHDFMAWVHSTFPEEEALKLDAICTHCDLIFKSALPNRDRRKQEDCVSRYAFTKTVLLEQM